MYKFFVIKINMETNKVAGIIIAIIVIIIIIGLIVWWCVSASGSNPNINPDHVKCLGTVQESLNRANSLTREWILRDNYDLACKDATLGAIERQYSIAFGKYHKGGCGDKANCAVDGFMSKFPIYNAVIKDSECLADAKRQVHAINEKIVKCITKDNCPQNSKLLPLLDKYDCAIFEQILAIQADSCDASIQAYYNSQHAMTQIFKFLSYSYLWSEGVHVQK